MKILAFDCSSKTMAAALAEDETVVASAFQDENRKHAPYLMPMIEELLEKVGWKPKDLHLIAVTAGPGSFTGLRIGVSTAKGFADTLDIPMVSLPSLDVLAGSFWDEKTIVVPMLDARKHQVYAAVFDNRRGEMKKIMADTPISPLEELSPFLKYYQDILFVGDAVPGWKQQLIDCYGNRARFVDHEQNGIHGESLIAIAAKKSPKDFVSDIAPIYLRGVDAKAKFLNARFFPLQEGDIEELMEVERGAFSSPWSEGMFRDELHNHFSEYWIIRTDGKLTAYGGFWHIGKECHVTNIAVHPDYRHLGQGTLMVQHLIARAQAVGAAAITLEVRVSNEQAIRIYHRAGFREEGIRPRYYNDNGEDAMVMWLRFPEDEKEKPWS